MVNFGNINSIMPPDTNPNGDPFPLKGQYGEHRDVFLTNRGLNSRTFHANSWPHSPLIDIQVKTREMIQEIR